MKKIFFFLAFVITGSSRLFAQIVDASPEITNICTGSSATLTATVTAPGTGTAPGSLPTTSYSISSIPFSPAPLTGGTSTSASDDSQVGPLPIGFNFCFFGATYSNFYIGSNGWLAFSSQPTTYTSATIPNTGASIPKNCIMGPWQDWNPSIGGGGPYINYQTSGTAPNRKLVVNWNNIPMFGSACTGLTGTFQIIIYESSNVIENYIVSKSSGCTWAGGTAVQGIHNAAGTVAFTVPGRNSTVWSASNEGWRYTPNGTATYTIGWYILPADTLIATGSSVTVTPVISPQYYYAKVNGPNGCGSGMGNTDTVVVNSTNLVVDAGPYVSICQGSSTMLNASGGFAYSWSPTTGLSDPNIANPLASPSSTTVYTVMVTGALGCIGFDTITVGVNPAPFADAGPASGICGGENIQMGGNASPGTYLWSPAGTLDDPTILTPTATPSITTTYTLTVTDAIGCTASDTASVTILNPNVDAGPNVAICPATSVQLTASGGDTYDWTPGTGLSDSTIANPIANPTSTITYTVIISNGTTGCVGTDSVTVTVNPPVMANAGPDTAICIGDSTTLNATGGIAYLWSPGATLNDSTVSNPVSKPTSSTLYAVMVTDALGCVGFDSVKVNINQLPLVSAGADLSICPGDTTTLNATGASTYFWTPPASLNNDSISNPLAFPSVMTDYIVTGTDVNGCVNKDTVTVSLNGLTITAGPNQTVCSGDSASLNVSGAATYVWSPAASLNNANIANPMAAPSGTTTYTVIGTSSTGCSDTAFITVTVRALPPVNAGTSLSTCTGGNANLSVTGANTYVWSPAATLSNAFIPTPVATPTVTTQYTVTGTDLNGCSNTDTMTVVVHSLPAANAGANTSICIGSSTILNGSGGGTYSWAPSSGLSSTTIANPVAAPVTTTTYTVTVMGAGFCSASSQVTITVNSLPTANAGADVSICNGASTVLNAGGGASYFWSPTTGLSSATSATPVATPSVTTTYTVTVSNAAGCTATDAVTVNVNNSISISPSTVTDETCANGDGAIVVGTPSGGASPYTFSLNGGVPQSTSTFGSLSQGTYTLLVSDAAGCASSQSISVGQIVNVNADFTANPPTGNKPLDVAFTNNSTGATSYFWDLGNGITSVSIDPSTIYTETGTYSVMLVASNGGYPCVDTARATIEVLEESVFIIPNIFTPNGDGKNDIFMLKSTGVRTVSGTIFNRWGKKIYEWNGDSNSGWDGSINGGTAQDGTYYYILRITTMDGTEKVEKGYVQLLSK